MKKHKRRIKLIKPRLQLKLTLIFVGLSALALGLQVVLFTSSLTRVALELPNDSLILMEGMNGLLLNVLFTTAVAFLPLTFAVGILSTFRIAGPIHRFEMFLKQIKNGEKPKDMRLRKGDELKDFCELMNSATAAWRQTDESSEKVSVEDPPSLVAESPQPESAPSR